MQPVTAALFFIVFFRKVEYNLKKKEAVCVNVVVAMDSFKGSLPSLAAGGAVAEGIRRVFPGAQLRVCPLADGGEGTAEALTTAMGGRLVQCTVAGPRLKPTLCTYGIVGRTAIIEAAGAAGLTLLRPEERDPRYATTLGVGQTIRHAIGQGCRRFVIGLGGSATNDGGAGMLQALGFSLWQADGTLVKVPGAAGLAHLSRITAEHVLPELKYCEFYVACDVSTPLCGPRGCSAVFGPQKGARPEMVGELEAWLCRFARCAAAVHPGADPAAPGSGAAGGLGFAFRTFLGAALEPGTELVLRETALAASIRQADLVFTGEGCLDGQTVLGKAPAGVARLAKQYGKPVIALAGCVTEEARRLADIDACFSILPGSCTLAEAMEPRRAAANLADTAEQICRLLRALRCGGVFL